MSQGVIVVDQTGRILLANHFSESLFGYGGGELRGLSIEDLMPERFRDRHVSLRSFFVRSENMRNMGIGLDLVGARKDGSEFPIEVSLGNAFVGEDRVSIACISDISIRKKADIALKKSEEQLMRYTIELEKIVKQRTEELQQSVAKLEKALVMEKELNTLQSKFISIISHEFRTPLSIIKSSNALIEKYAVVHDTEKIATHTQRINGSVDLLVNILNDLLSLGKLKKNAVPLEKSVIDLPAFIGELIEEFSMLQKKGQRIASEFLSSIPTVYTDQRALYVILSNLLSNAIKYSPEGAAIFIRLSLENGCLCINIVDEGIGIPLNEAHLIGKQFFRAKNVSEIQGTGLGLSIVQRYVELLGGELSFNSTEKKGSSFAITIPYETVGKASTH